MRAIPLLVVTTFMATGSYGAVATGEFVRGVNYAHIHRRGHGYGSDVSNRQLRRLKTVGVDWIALTPFGYQRGADADHIVGFDVGADRGGSLGGRDPTLTDRDLETEIEHAHALGIKVVLKPHIWSRDFWGGREWHGTIRQSSRQAHQRWWASYRAFCLYYAEVARRAGAEAYCVGTELARMTRQYPHEWRALIREVRKVYPGYLTYGAHWNEEFERIGFWDLLDAIGINAYFPLDVPDGASVDELAAAWRPHRRRIETVQARFGKPVVFIEVGYRSATGSYRQPWRYQGGRPDGETQARAYAAMFRALGDAPWWRGLFCWKTFTDPTFAHRRGEGAGFTFLDKPAESVIRRWYLTPVAERADPKSGAEG